MSSRNAETLHITNGDSVIYLFKKAGIVGTHLAWRDVLHEGPVPAGLSLPELSRVRGTYLASRGFGNPIKIMRDLEQRDATLARAADFVEIVLWFEHDLYDQLHLIQILPLLHAQGVPPGTVTIVQTSEYLGRMTADEISALHPKRRPVPTATFAAARAAWDAFTAPDPQALLAAMHAEHHGLPHLAAALKRLAQEYPWVGDGLSRSHRQALHAVTFGGSRKDELYRRAEAAEEAPFLGDAAFAAILEDIIREPALIEAETTGFAPTALGRRVLAGDADYLEAAPCDRWIGGVRLHGPAVTRWDDDVSSLHTIEQALDS